MEAIKKFYTESSNKLNEDKLKKKIQDPTSLDGQKISLEIEESIGQGKITDELILIWEYIKPTIIKKLQDLEIPENIKQAISAVIEELKTKKIFILSEGELENYDTNKVLGYHSAKKVIEKISELEGANSTLKNCGFEDGEFIEFLKLIKE